MYPWVLHQKLDFIRQAIRNNPFGSEYFAWFDAGTGHGNINVAKHWCPCNFAAPGMVTMIYQKDGNIVGSGKPAVDLEGLTLERYKKLDHNSRAYTNPIGTFWGGHKDGAATKTWLFLYLFNFVGAREIRIDGCSRSRAGLMKLFRDYNYTVQVGLSDQHRTSVCFQRAPTIATPDI